MGGEQAAVRGVEQRGEGWQVVQQRVGHALQSSLHRGAQLHFAHKHTGERGEGGEKSDPRHRDHVTESADHHCMEAV